MKKALDSKVPPAVNFHLWEPCNMKCKFCFATFQDVKESILPKGHLPEEDALKIIQLIAEAGFEKITFAGGEPTLCTWLYKLIISAKSLGMTTSIVTNGTNLSETFLDKVNGQLDWIALSVDSLDEATNIKAGRAKGGKYPLGQAEYLDIIERVKKRGIKLKINTVVHALNYQEDMSNFIRLVNPKRWKVFQVLPIVGQNDTHINEFKITQSQFEVFKNTHANLSNHVKIVIEDNTAMTGSYAMIDPAGRFFDNTKSRLTYSKPILTCGVEEAFNQVQFSEEVFTGREGRYDWR